MSGADRDGDSPRAPGAPPGGSSASTRYHACTLCETGCGLAFTVAGGEVTGVAPDDDDVFSAGFVCPKGMAINAVGDDPDRLRSPVRRDAHGAFRPISWDDALDLVCARLNGVRRAHGDDAVAVYMGTPVVHKHSALIMRSALLSALRTRNSTSAGSQDTSPRFAASYFLYGSSFSVPVPDVDRTHYFLCIGANPLVSNGSLLTAPDMRGRIRAIRERGGKVVVVDPRRTETARAASEHLAIRPGGDAALLFAMAQVLVARGRVDEARLRRDTRGWAALRERLAELTPERVSACTQIPKETIERIALEFADAPSSAAYARIGVCNGRFATLASFAVDLLNLIAGRLGAAGGALFSSPAIDFARLSRVLGIEGHGRFRSRVRGLPETLGDVPASTLAEEIETAGEGQVRALLTYAGNPVLSVPNGRRLAAALSKLEFMVSIDLYVNETTRFADVILPPAWSTSEDHVDFFFSNFAVRNVIRWNTPVTPRKESEREDWEILAAVARGMGDRPTGYRGVDWALRIAGRLGFRWTPAHAVDLALRLGPYGDRYLPFSSGLNGQKVRESVHGVDLGPLRTGFRHRVRHRDGRVDVAPPAILASFDELRRDIDRPVDPGELLLIGRRDLRSNNSWMHNIPALVRGRERCVLFVHPDDARRAGVEDGAVAVMESRVHEGQVRVRVTDEVRPGVVSLPHGFGHAEGAAFQRVAGAHAGVSANDWTDDQRVESVVGQSILNGVPVRLRRAAMSDRGASADAKSEPSS